MTMLPPEGTPPDGSGDASDKELTSYSKDPPPEMLSRSLMDLPPRLQLEIAQELSYGPVTQAFSILHELAKMKSGQAEAAAVLKPQLVETLSKSKAEKHRALHWTFGVSAGEPLADEVDAAYTPLIGDSLGTLILNYPLSMHWFAIPVGDAQVDIRLRESRKEGGRPKLTTTILLNQHGPGSHSGNITTAQPASETEVAPPTREVRIALGTDSQVVSVSLGETLHTEGRRPIVPRQGLSMNLDDLLADILYKVRQTDQAYRKLRGAITPRDLP